VITANTSSLAEIAAGVAETVDPHDVEALTAAFVRLAGDEEHRRELSRRGLARAREFSWARTAKEMLALYERVAVGAFGRVGRVGRVSRVEAAGETEHVEADGATRPTSPTRPSGVTP
jgi:hypothetical protein